jgi:rod shape-determining protein MreB
MTLALHRYLRSEHQMLVGELTVDALKCRVDLDEGLSSVVHGIDLATGRPRLLTLEADEVLEALRPTADAIIAALAGALDDLPPQSADDILTDGILVFGGSTMLRGFAKLVEAAFAFPVRMAERPLTCVAEGAARCLSDPDVVRAYEGTFIDAM